MYLKILNIFGHLFQHPINCFHIHTYSLESNPIEKNRQYFWSLSQSFQQYCKQPILTMASNQLLPQIDLISNLHLLQIFDLSCLQMLLSFGLKIYIQCMNHVDVNWFIVFITILSSIIEIIIFSLVQKQEQIIIYSLHERLILEIVLLHIQPIQLQLSDIIQKPFTLIQLLFYVNRLIYFLDSNPFSNKNYQMIIKQIGIKLHNKIINQPTNSLNIKYQENNVEFSYFKNSKLLNQNFYKLGVLTIMDFNNRQIKIINTYYLMKKLVSYFNFLNIQIYPTQSQKSYIYYPLISNNFLFL
ncbi:unnamed protein product [Paramecium primaurelia]|uniref:Transmembrane protein n=1 Tax=Paramecium primaurelia TaxID=5886 RepID=A0A8S1JR50_PARPR|nr:unnamed protein product [Paramecium primaurelia]